MTETTLLRRNFYVYMLLRLNGIPFYVGRGTGSRIKMHEYKARRGRSYKNNIICQIMDQGLEVPKAIVADNLTHEEANLMEIALIAMLGRHPNGPLVNMTKGGEGILELPPEALERKRAKLRARKATPETRAKISRAASNPSPETRAKMSAAHRGKKEDAAATEKRRQALTGRKRTPETRARVRAALLNRPAEIYVKAAASRQGYHHSEETKALLREASRQAWLEHREAILTGMAKRPPPSEETKALWSMQRKGKKKPPKSEAAKEKLRQANLGKTHSAGARAKISAALRARPPQSEETRQKRRESVLRTIARKKSTEKALMPREMKRPPPSFDPREAPLEATEAKRWQCLSCDAPIDPDREEHPGYCWPCGSYWEDVRNGLWDDPL